MPRCLLLSAGGYTRKGPLFSIAGIARPGATPLTTKSSHFCPAWGAELGSNRSVYWIDWTSRHCPVLLGNLRVGALIS